MRLRILLSFLAVVMMHNTFCNAEDVEHARQDSEDGCGVFNWDMTYPCDPVTNRNYACSKSEKGQCWRGDHTEETRKVDWYKHWCYTDKKCNRGDDESCLDQASAPCEGCGQLYGTNLDTCGTDCGFEKWTVEKSHACDRTTNRNYGCYKQKCWRSEAYRPRKWCYTDKSCEDGNHESCMDQVESPCGCTTGCGVFNTINHDCCEVSCGKKEWDDLHYGCEESNNRNYGCDHNHACWRSDENDPRGWCFTGEFCDYEDDYHQGCQKVKYNDRPHRKGTLQTELPCGEPYYRIESWKKAGPGAPNGE